MELAEYFDVSIPEAPVSDKRYVGWRPDAWRKGTGPPPLVVEVHQGGQRRPLPMHGRHSAEFEWGYGGSGPAELALAILADHLGFEPPPTLYQKFKFEVVARFRRDAWALAASDVARWLGTRLREPAQP